MEPHVPHLPERPVDVGISGVEDCVRELVCDTRQDIVVIHEYVVENRVIIAGISVYDLETYVIHIILQRYVGAAYGVRAASRHGTWCACEYVIDSDRRGFLY